MSLDDSGIYTRMTNEEKKCKNKSVFHVIFARKTYPFTILHIQVVKVKIKDGFILGLMSAGPLGQSRLSCSIECGGSVQVRLYMVSKV